MTPEVAHTGEVQRVASLPRRVWATEDLERLAGELTEILRMPVGSPCPSKPAPTDTIEARRRNGLCPNCGVPLRLRHVQALALHDAGVMRGLFGSIGVGEGKTLSTLLTSVVLGAERPMLLVPGGLVEKTQRERLALSYHWRIPDRLRVFSYDLLSRVDHVDELTSYTPDALICDEVHRLKNKRAAVTRRVARWMDDHPETSFVGVSGTIMDKSLHDFAHILLWALKWNAPVPTTTEEIEEWAQAIDNDVDPPNRRRAGALLTFGVEPGTDELTAARRVFRRRLTETPGVVATVGAGEHVDCSIYVRAIVHPVSRETERNFDELRQWRTPAGEELMYGVDVWRHAQELALGLIYVWDPPAPLEWLESRKEWHRFVRETISRSRSYDSELHVAQAVDAGVLRDGREALARWREIGPTFTPNVIPVWHDTSALDAVAAWMRKAASGGIVWTEHGFFAERLSQHTGARYYGAGGFAADGSYIEDAATGSAVIASIDANREGKNLQQLWHRNLMVCPPKSAAWWEQTIARTHRSGQTADEVIVDVLLGCRENFDNCLSALEGARAIQDTTGKSQKLLLADVTLPAVHEIEALAARSARWRR